MRYTTEFKLMCVELYRQGKWVKTPKGIKTANFRNKIRTWNRIEQAGGPGALCHKAHYLSLIHIFLHFGGRVGNKVLRFRGKADEELMGLFFS